MRSLAFAVDLDALGAQRLLNLSLVETNHDFVTYHDYRNTSLACECYHLLKLLFISRHIDVLKLNVVLVEIALSLPAPWTCRCRIHLNHFVGHNAPLSHPRMSGILQQSSWDRTVLDMFLAQ